MIPERCDEVTQRLRNMGAAIRFIEADELHWKKKCEVKNGL